jgi:hypothetical protein
LKIIYPSKLSKDFLRLSSILEEVNRHGERL